MLQYYWSKTTRSWKELYTFKWTQKALKPKTKGVVKNFGVVEFWVVDSSLQGCNTVLLDRCFLASQRIYGTFKFRAKPSKRTLLSLLDLANEGTIILWNSVTTLRMTQHHIPEYLTLQQHLFEGSQISLFWVTELWYISGDFLHFILIFPCLFISTIYYQIVENCPYFLHVVISYFPCLFEAYAYFSGIISQMWVTICYGCHLVTVVRLTAI